MTDSDQIVKLEEENERLNDVLDSVLGTKEQAAEAAKQWRDLNDPDPRATILMGNRWVTPEERQEIWYEQEAKNHILACPRVSVSTLLPIIPEKYLTRLSNDAKLLACCRNPREHEIEAFFTTEADEKRGVPDVYVLHCKCGRKHRRFCVGGSIGSGVPYTEPRPFWDTTSQFIGLRIGVNVPRF